MTLNRVQLVGSLLSVGLGLGVLMSSTPSWAGTPVSRPQVAVTQDSGSLKTLQAEAIVNAPIDAVWQDLSDYSNMKNLLPGYDRSTVLQSAGNLKTVDLGLKGSGFMPPFRYQVQIREDKAAYRMQIQRIAGDFKAINASYQLTPIDGGTHTRVVYHLSIDLGGLPLFGAGSILKTNTAKAMQVLQSHCAERYQRSMTAQAVR